jgi:ubiquinone/menaquinone biosynthesis C-methylase UbiE
VQLEERKIKEIEHSRIRRTILQGFERRSDTNVNEQAPRLELMIRDNKAFKRHFSNTRFYSITHQSDDFQRGWLRARCAPGVKVLDFACGNGENGIYAAKCGADVVGIDISPEGIANANLNARMEGVSDRCSFQVMDGENMAFPDDTFDIAVEYGALHHVELRTALKELNRVLRPSGQMICIEALKHNPLIHRYRKRTPHLRTKWEVDHILGIDDLNVVREHFEEVSAKFFHLAVLAAVPFRKSFLFKPLRIFLDLIDLRLLRIPFLGKYAWITIFTMKHPLKSSRASCRFAG